MDGFLKQSTASQARLIGPFVDNVDFKTAETGLTIANTDIKLRANGTTLSNKNSGGGTHQVNGMYSVTWDATDTANVGELKYSVDVSGALQVFGSYVVVEEAIYDALFAASAAGYASQASVDTIDDFLDTEVAAILAAVDTEVAAIKANTDNLPSAVKANTARRIPFKMVLSTDHVTPATGLTVTAQVSLNGAAFAGCSGSVTEIANGWYYLEAAAGDLNATNVVLKFTAATADQSDLAILTEP